MTMIIRDRTTVIFIFIVVAVLAGFGLYYFAIQKETIESPAIASEETPPIQATTTSETKTYRNEEWGFEFQYLENWAIEENYSTNYYSKFNLRIIPINERHSKIPIVINIVLPEFVKNSFRGIEKISSEIIIDGVSGTKYEYEFGGRQEIAIILPLDDLRMIIGTDDSELYLDALNQILTTFKFLK